MRNLKAYTLTEVMVVMIIMITLLGLAFSSYSSFTEATKFNEDVSTIQHDILIIQRASMLMQRDDQEDWIYGLVIDFGGIHSGDGTYDFYKWCSASADFSTAEKNSEYPAEGGPIPSSLTSDYKCTGSTNRLVNLVGYGYGALNLGDDVHIDSNIRFVVFESVSGRAFLYGGDNKLIEDPNTDLQIIFDKNYGQSKILTIKNLTGRTNLSDVVEGG